MAKKIKKVFTRFRTHIFSRHPSHSPLRRELPLLPFRSVVRLGSTTRSRPGYIECNTITGVKASADKLLMKRAFDRAGVHHAAWVESISSTHQLELPVVVKHRFGSRGTGNTLHDLLESIDGAIDEGVLKSPLESYIVEKFYSYSREYRLHVTSEGCFYTCRKMLREGTPENQRWHRHDENSVWIMESNPSFNKPVNWVDIVADCVKALAAVGLDIGAFDVKVQSANDSKGRPRPNPEWIVIESCSAPSMAEHTLKNYKEQIPRLLKRKYANS